MMRRPVLTRTVIFLALAVASVVPAYGEDPPPANPDDGLTRETFTDPNAPAHPPEPTHTVAHAHRRRTHLRSKNYVSVHHARRHHRTAKNPARIVASSRPPRRRNPVVRFVYWWNGWVIRTFHTKFGTVLLGTVGAES